MARGWKRQAKKTEPFGIAHALCIIMYQLSVSVVVKLQWSGIFPS
jgi:hypothetical protein